MYIDSSTSIFYCRVVCTWRLSGMTYVPLNSSCHSLAGMDASSVIPKSSSDPTTSLTMEPAAKRRHLPSETSLFRVLCPTTKAASLTSLIRHLQTLTGTKIHINSFSSSSVEDECVIHIISNSNNHKDRVGTATCEEEEENKEDEEDNEGCSPAQQALLRIFDRMVRVSSDEKEKLKENDREWDGLNSGDVFSCRLLAASSQVGCVLGRGGKIVEKIRHESGAQVRVLSKDHLPPCASAGDELILISGNFSAVKKALLSVSSCLQDNPRVDTTNSGSTKPSLGVLYGTSLLPHVDPFPQRGFSSSLHAGDYHLRGYYSFSGPENTGSGNRMFLEEEVIFKLLCQLEKVGSLIGKGGCIIRALQSETGASIKIADAACDSDERVVVISARENSEQKHSPAQEAVIQVHCRIAQIGFEPGAAVVARLLVHSQQIGCLLGKGGFIINEMRRATGASIRIFPKEQVPKCGYPNDEVVQVIGSFQSVQDALFHITSRLRETILPMNPLSPNLGAPPYLPRFPEMPPFFRPRHNPASPRNYPSPVGHSHGHDRSAFPSQAPDYPSSFSHGTDRSGPSNMDRVPYPCGSERPGHCSTFDRPSSSPRPWNPQTVSSGNHRGTSDVFGLASKNGPLRSGSQAPIPTSTNIEITIPETCLGHVRGENNSHLTQIQQSSGAKVLINDLKPGATEGVVLVSGTPKQTHAAQSLIQAFIFCGQTPP
ncbi:KH domain-containing protein HEN4 isoform X2 [Juglans microcarpa x Juglans regia]|uniref:KH domain-containing protein HEN4 isoform X2 n=1 Tax=Juglans microcarpa x Juglans regia TaxID=2249226 RepID=UPI001B7DF0DB|nr:KH domain-containing protein HEN4 isoform X2 [Juglans microcarpa x Juglans regia]